MEQSDKEHLRVFYMDEKHYLLVEEVYDVFKIDKKRYIRESLWSKG